MDTVDLDDYTLIDEPAFIAWANKTFDDVEAVYHEYKSASGSEWTGVYAEYQNILIKQRNGRWFECTHMFSEILHEVLNEEVTKGNFEEVQIEQ